MAAAHRIYHVLVGGQARLVRATHPSHAIQHVARELITCRVASTEDVAELLPKGVQVEQIKHEQTELPTT